MRLAWPGRPGSSFLHASEAAIASLSLVGRESTARGTEALSKLTRAPFRVEASETYLVPAAALGRLLTNAAAARTIATLQISREAKGFGLLAFDEAASFRMADLCLGKPLGSTPALGSLEESAIAEVANIALNRMVGAAADLADASFQTTVPQTSFRTKDTVQALVGAAGPSEHAIVIETAFVEPTSGVRGLMGLVFFAKTPTW